MSMRMRKKRNFDARMEACGDLLLARGANGILNMKEAAESYRALIDFSAAFGNNNPVALEIGCGKGGFVIATAKKEQSVNFLALEKMSNVILTPMEEVKRQGIENIRFLNIRAECLPCYIPEKSLDCIYLNFSTPLPKLGYATQRLTHRNFLEVYKKLLKDGGKILQKTDDRDFFDFSLEEYRACGFALENVTYNLHENGNPDWNVVTEYEQKWVERGLPIHRVEAVLK
ncbi:MAG: tRNA (guanosine(46)-N7)-methyltransferase TrmB [Clostridia bacterium]|nr:tRNA (guanosine(46)-N7)-methyltransferase TrmB [Clostridia bacterium]MBQ7924657.1 tRNA (guanosine(46)-N7)-methyltransferase TrmB [Clostridia bacterium]